jgi:hypothetical protein
MGRIKLPHVNSFRNRHGTMVFYFRKRSCKSVRLRGVPGSAEFMAAYAEAVEGQKPIEIGAKRSPAGSVAATIGLYLGSTAFANLATETQRTRRNILERFREQHGDKRIAAIERKHVQAMVTAKGQNAVGGTQFPQHLASHDRLRDRRRYSHRRPDNRCQASQDRGGRWP